MESQCVIYGILNNSFLCLLKNLFTLTNASVIYNNFYERVEKSYLKIWNNIVVIACKNINKLL